MLIRKRTIQFVPTRSYRCCHSPISSENNLKMKDTRALEEIIDIGNIVVAYATTDKKRVFKIYAYLLLFTGITLLVVK